MAWESTTICRKEGVTRWGNAETATIEIPTIIESDSTSILAFMQITLRVKFSRRWESQREKYCKSQWLLEIQQRLWDCLEQRFSMNLINVYFSFASKVSQFRVSGMGSLDTLTFQHEIHTLHGQVNLEQCTLSITSLKFRIYRKEPHALKSGLSSLMNKKLIIYCYWTTSLILKVNRHTDFG